MTDKVRVRFAPSPTGPLHIGGVRTALYNYLYARKHNGSFVLRIEDTDQSRYVQGAEEYIRDSLNWLGIGSDEGPDQGGSHGPYRQSERKDSYREFAERLVEKGCAYYAFDTPDDLEEMREKMKKAGVSSPKYNYLSREYMKNSLALSQDEVQKLFAEGHPYVIRLKVPRQEELKVKDEVRGWVSFHSNQLDDKVLLKTDGMPTYHLANVVDDHQMAITHVIRGEEWLPSTPIHQLLYEYLEWDEPVFAHLPLILKPDGDGKLSKRDGDRLGFPVFPLEWTDPETGEKSKGYREEGYLPDAVLNILALLGWNPGTEQEVFSKEELIDQFSLDRVGKSGAKFDPDKARWYNQQFLRRENDEVLAEKFMPVVKDKGMDISKGYLVKVAGLVKEKASFIHDFWDIGHFFFKRPEEYDETVLQKKWNAEVAAYFEELILRIEKMDTFNAEHLEEHFKALAKEKDEKHGKFMQPFRVLLTGETSGPGLFQVAELLGREEVIKRLKQGIKAAKTTPSS